MLYIAQSFRIACIVLCYSLVGISNAQSQTVLSQNAAVQRKIDSLRVNGNYVGLSIAVASDEGVVHYASGYADSVQKKPIKANSYFLSGSVGKTYCAAIILKLIEQQKINLDEFAKNYLQKFSWYKRVPNADSLTIRQLLNHTTGLKRYEFNPNFLKDLTASPDKVWKGEDLLSYVFDDKPSFSPGKDWDYSDTNYILLAMIIEAVTGESYYKLIQDWLLTPNGLVQTKPSDSRTLPGLVQGYAGDKNDFGGKNEVIGSDGKFIINPQFEWSGGGIYQTTTDLARWMHLLHTGKILSAQSMYLMMQAVPSKLGRNTQYGLGVIIRKLPDGLELVGHSGFFPGYVTETYYIPSKKITIALQTNTSDFPQLKIHVLKCLSEIASLL